jgi:hypothetical protein
LALRSGYALAARQANHGETQPAEIHLKTADPCPGKPGQLRPNEVRIEQVQPSRLRRS